MEIFYATNRAPDLEKDVYFGGMRGDLSFGIAQIGIPPNHIIGRQEKPSVFKFEWTPDERKHIALQGIQPLALTDFLQRLRTTVSASPGRKVMLFVHGYNVSFTKASEDLAQFATDLKFDGPALLFSWPSQNSMMGYTKDETNVEWAQPYLAQIMTRLLDQTPTEELFLVAHSMGSRALTRAYNEVTQKLPAEITANIREIILIAPDIDTDLFSKDIAPMMARTGVHITLYASSADRALLASKAFHGYPRAGDSRQGLAIVNGVETVDASDTEGGLLGHSYFAEDRRIMEDIYAILLTGQRADSRFGLQSVETPGGRFWSFRK